MKRFLCSLDFRLKLLRNHELSQRSVCNVLGRCYSQGSNLENKETCVSNEAKDESRSPAGSKVDKKTISDSRISQSYSDVDNSNTEFDWFTKALEPALQLIKRALPAGNGYESKLPPSSRSVSEIISSIQRSKVGVQDWSLSDLTLGLYLLYLRQASTIPFEDIKGVQISCDAIVEDLIYHTELAKGAYKDSVAGLAKNSMLRESNVLKFVKTSNVLRPGYYIGVDMRKKLVILGIRGTHAVSDLITDLVSSSHEEVLSERFLSHFGTAEAAGWFLSHELGTIKKCLEKHEGFRLRLVGHSLGGATASILAIIMRQKSSRELGFSPDNVSAVGYGTPPCISRELADGCSDYVTNVVMQDDIVPRLSVASLTRLRNEILQTDWMSVLQKKDRECVTDLLTNAKQVVSSVQDVARKLADYAKFKGDSKFLDIPVKKDSIALPGVPATTISAGPVPVSKKEEVACKIPEELFVPGTVYCLRRHVGTDLGTNHGKAGEFFTLWKRHPGEHVQRILLSSNVLSDHKCDNHYYALRDVLKGLPGSG